MSEAKEAYYKLKHELEQIDDYVTELEAETEQLKNSQSQKQKIKLHEKIEQLEVEKAELLKYIEFAGKCCNSHGAYEYGKTFQSILKKHGVSL